MSKKSAAIVASVSEDEFKDYIGHNAYKLKVERQAALQGKTFFQSPTLLALIVIIPFAVIYWLGYHKWWRMLFTVALIIASMSLFLVALDTPMWINTLISMSVMLALALWLPVKYVVHASQQIAHFKSLEKDPKRLSILLQKKGGTSALIGVLAVLFSIALNLSIIYLFVPSAFNVVVAENAEHLPSVENQKSFTPILVSDSEKIETRYGQMEIAENENGEAITFNGKVISEPSNILSLETYFIVGDSDVILAADHSGGTACPAEYFFVTINQNNTVRLSEKFGTCSDMAESSQTGDTITVSMPGANRRHMFTFRSGILDEAVEDKKSIDAGGLPECDSEQGIADTKRALENSPAANLINVQVFDIEAAKEIAYNPEDGSRVCEGIALTNGGKVHVTYTFEDRGNDEYWIEAYAVDMADALQ